MTDGGAPRIDRDKLRELAEAGAKAAHYFDAMREHHDAENFACTFDICVHPDCVLVRAALSASSARREEPDLRARLQALKRPSVGKAPQVGGFDMVAWQDIEAALSAAPPARPEGRCPTCGLENRRYYEQQLERLKKLEAGEAFDAARVLREETASQLEVIVNGQPVTVTAGTVRDVIAQAIRLSGQIGAPVAQWELRTTEGDVIPHNLTDGTDYELAPGRRLWLNLGLPVGKESLPAAPLRATPASSREPEGKP